MIGMVHDSVSSFGSNSLSLHNFLHNMINLLWVNSVVNSSVCMVLVERSRASGSRPASLKDLCDCKHCSLVNLYQLSCRRSASGLSGWDVKSTSTNLDMTFWMMMSSLVWEPPSMSASLHFTSSFTMFSPVFSSPALYKSMVSPMSFKLSVTPCLEHDETIWCDNCHKS